MNGRDDRLADLVEGVDPAGQQIAAKVQERIRCMLILDVRARAKPSRTGPADYDDRNIGIPIEFTQRVADARSQRVVDRIDLPRTVEDDMACLLYTSPSPRDS